MESQQLFGKRFDRITVGFCQEVLEPEDAADGDFTVVVIGPDGEETSTGLTVVTPPEDDDDDEEPWPTPTDEEPSPTPTDEEPSPTPTDEEPTPTPTEDEDPSPSPTDDGTPSPTDEPTDDPADDYKDPGSGLATTGTTAGLIGLVALGLIGAGLILIRRRSALE
ncbi:hypothetical protein HGQ17_12915 [Nesterenkonia sp. MY13]|uniref:LPXTG cell wall anchor domain-containing protein n=1 Tax=Nesterenkonia sedimenti TaxID=1463632 RepID=A0A7X8TLG7_9MICC|nr:hypothetical protein [Nesterenkonia sedimenti]NLS10878.1 hypothetical protein [Nesterenkonia sedimenti]